MPNFLKYLLVSLLLSALAGCNPIGKIVGKSNKPLPVESPVTPTPLTISVEPLYANAANWADYVKRSDLETTCDGTESGVSPCLHGGDKRKVVLKGVTTCSGLSMTDSENAFFWRCDESSGEAVFYSVLSSEKTLGDLLDATDWKHLTVTLHGGFHDGVTSSALVKWWTNAIIEAPDNSVTCTNVPGEVVCEASGRAKLVSNGAVYKVSLTRASFETKGYKITGDNISFTTMPGVVVKGQNVTNCTSDDDDTGTLNTSCVLQTYNNKFLWIEGKFTRGQDPSSTVIPTFNIFVKKTDLSTFRRIETALSNKNLIFVDGSESNNFSQLKLSNGFNGIWVEELLTTGKILDSNVFSQLLIDSIASVGIYAKAATNTYFNATTISNIDKGATAEDLTGPTNIHNTLIVNAVENGMNFNTVDKVTVGQIGLFNANKGLNLADVGNSRFTGNMLIGGMIDKNCEIALTTPLFQTTCLPNAAGSPMGYPSDHNIVAKTNIQNAFVGNIKTSNFASAADWLLNDWLDGNFLDSYGKPGTFMSGATQGSCDSASSSCVLRSYELLATDTILLNQTNDGVTANGAFVIGAACLAAVSGSAILENAERNKTYLKSAIEIDGIGNGNGLCESGETCLYTPNFGVYQGHGNFGECNFSDGVVIDVKMFGYETNGY